MLKQHEYYVYYQGNLVMARRKAEAPVVAEECASPQAAHDKVQSVVNPHARPASYYRRHDKSGQVQSDLGYHDPAFQGAISDNCKAYVEAAYKAAGK